MGIEYIPPNLPELAARSTFNQKREADVICINCSTSETYTVQMAIQMAQSDLEKNPEHQIKVVEVVCW